MVWVLELMTVDQMYAADAAAVVSGVTGEALMEAAGLKVATEIRARCQPAGRRAVRAWKQRRRRLRGCAASAGRLAGIVVFARWP